MDLTKLYEMQKVLMDRIDYNGKDRFDKTILALLVEVGECANEWRGFKYWSQNQEARNSCMACQVIETPHICKNPLLEEYVDGLHFVLQIGIELGYEDVEPYTLIPTNTLNVFQNVYKWALDLSVYKEKSGYEMLLSEYISLGYHLGFKDDDILLAYISKNEVNHERQENGY